MTDFQPTDDNGPWPVWEVEITLSFLQSDFTQEQVEDTVLEMLEFRECDSGENKQCIMCVATPAWSIKDTVLPGFTPEELAAIDELEEDDAEKHARDKELDFMLGRAIDEGIL